jgi:hypothetical protein
VFREKYPEIFSPEAKGRETRRSIAQTLADHPQFTAAWLRWMKDIAMTLEQAMKWMSPRPKPLEVDHSVEEAMHSHEGFSAADVRDAVRVYSERLPQLKKRLPKIE